MIYPHLYNRDTQGRLRFWFMEVDGYRYRSGYGIEGSETTYTNWTTAQPKNEGRANATKAEQQARLEVEAHYTKKRDRGFSDDPASAGRVKFVKPMLAQKFEPKRIEGQPWIAVQPKLDGIRCFITADGAKTRNGKQIHTVGHITEALAWAFEENPDLVLDGELYNHSLKDDFNKISSLVKKLKPKPEDLELASRLIEYHVYDVPSEPGDYVDRFMYMKHVVVGSGIDRVHTRFCIGHEYADCMEDVAGSLETGLSFQSFIERWHGRYIQEGYEGTMIRLPAPYQHKRTHNLLKFKDFQDDEFEIVEVQEGNGNWAGFAKRVELRLPDGRLFGAGIKGNQEQAKELLATKDQYVGKLATVRYFALTPDGVPRFPVVVEFDPVDR